jgi:hypothetical protein
MLLVSTLETSTGKSVDTSNENTRKKIRELRDTRGGHVTELLLRQAIPGVAEKVVDVSDGNR